MLEQGRVIEEGPTKEVIEHPALLDRSGEMGPMNILRITETRPDASGCWHGNIGGQSLSLPPMFSPATSGLISFPPNVVAILLGPGATGSVRNRLTGTIRHIHACADRVLVGIDVGQVIWAEITPEACQDLDLAVDTRVICTIKVRSITWIA